MPIKGKVYILHQLRFDDDRMLKLRQFYYNVAINPTK